ncbi:MAG: hypothetical protein RL669_328 [Pseudomonadota bacterium]
MLRPVFAIGLAALLASGPALAQLKPPATEPAAPAPLSPALPAAPAAAPAAPAAAPATPTAAPAAPEDPALRAKADAARKVADKWLAQLDAGDFAGAWEQTAQAFRTAVPKAQWQEGVGAGRKALGALKERKGLEAGVRDNLKGGPPGEYVTIAYLSQFTNRPEVREIVTMYLESGRWRVIGFGTD